MWQFTENPNLHYEKDWKNCEYCFNDTNLYHSDDGPALVETWIVTSKNKSDTNYPKILVDVHWFFEGLNVTNSMSAWCDIRGIDVNNLSDQDRQEIKMYMKSLDL